MIARIPRRRNNPRRDAAPTMRPQPPTADSRATPHLPTEPRRTIQTIATPLSDSAPTPMPTRTPMPSSAPEPSPTPQKLRTRNQPQSRIQTTPPQPMQKPLQQPNRQPQPSRTDPP